MYKRLLPYDIYERHKKIGSLITPEKSIVDIGGELNHLSNFCNVKSIIVANLSSGDVIIKKDKLPFERNSFDIACAIDVLEHMPKKERKAFIEKLIFIARDQVIMSFPIYTKEHQIYEKETIIWLKKRGENVKYLEEHLKYGLPRNEEIQQIFKNMKTHFSYSGDININKVLFRIYMFDPKVKIIRRLVYITKLLLYILTNDIFYALLINKKMSPKVNRLYISIQINK